MAIGPAVPLLPPEQRAVHAVVFAFAWSIALVLNLSSAAAGTTLQHADHHRHHGA
jgi:hypothetical protein